MASGAAVLADGSTVERIKQQHRELLGIEMEAYGVFAASEEAAEPRPTVFAMKSVVDFGDATKDDRFQKYGAYTSAQTLRYFVEHYL
jgi:nucleoside phosphorylase